MNLETLRDICLAIPEAEERTPFDLDTPAYMLGGRIFALFFLAPRDGRFFVNLKCAPERSVALRERYTGIIPAYHMNKRLWITVYLDSDVPDGVIAELVAHSAEEVRKRLPKKYKKIM